MASSRFLDEMLNRQIRRWELEPGRQAARPIAPSLALSRLPGSGAAELGQEVARRLDFGFFGIEIVDMIARDTGTQRDLVAGLDEHLRSAIERYLMDASHGRTYTESSYHEQLVRTLATLGEGGYAVILGRGSPFLLRPERTLRVLVVAPRAERVERLAKRHDLTTQEATHRLEQEEADRLAFNRHHFHVDPDDSTLYDLVVNTGSLGPSVAADVVEKAARRRFPQLA